MTGERSPSHRVQSVFVRHAYVNRTLLARAQERIRAEYEMRLSELERERIIAGPDKLEQYKTLLVKQRDIMLTLTENLQQKDKRILDLQSSMETLRAKQRCLALPSPFLCCHAAICQRINPLKPDKCTL